MKYLILLLTLLDAAPCLRAEAVVSNVWAAQIPGTHQVRITYKLAAAAPCTVSIQAWIEGATSGLSVPATAFSGDITGTTGNLVSPGTDKSITLTVPKSVEGKDPDKAILQNTFTKNLRFKVLATESTGPVTYGDMVQIEGGAFQMGDQSNPLVGNSDELPVHTVEVNTFYMGRYEVSWGLWKQVRDWALASGLGYDLPDGAGKADDHPVHSISWFAMVKWCNARTEYENATLGTNATPCYTVSGAVYRTGSSTPDCNFAANGYRLPTEAEWEKAARGGQPGYNFPWGNDITHEQANYYSTSSYTYDKSLTRGHHPTYSYNTTTPYTSPVGIFGENNYFLCDVTGNLWEACWDWYGSYPTELPIDSNPHGPSSGPNRVIRGGGWASSLTTMCRVSYRLYIDSPGLTMISGVGFRVARSSVP